MGKLYRGPFKLKRLPKSFVAAWASGLLALLVAFPMAAFGKAYEVSLLSKIGNTLFFACWVACFISIAYFGSNLLAGAYRDIQERRWRDQVW
jgi:hypothetical protein